MRRRENSKIPAAGQEGIMQHLFQELLAQGKTNFIFIGRAGCGKSEIALNLALAFAAETRKSVHFFDMDMTKPLFRSRDKFGNEEFEGVQFHYEVQFYDAPTLVGGVRELMRDPECIVVMDVGGDDIGARSIGGFMMRSTRSDTAIFYVLNVYRPFCADIDHIDRFVAEILAVSHIRVEELHMIHNPNLGVTTTPEEIVEGVRRMDEILEGVKEIELVCVTEELYDSVKDQIATESMPVRTFLTYEWLQ